MNPVLLTGATGFIGRRLQSALAADGTGVMAVVRPASPHLDRLDGGVEKLLFSLSDAGQLDAAIARASAVIYCAGSVRGRTLEDFRAANIDGVRSVVDSMNRVAAQTPLLLISSLAASRPRVSDYANSKYLGEREVSQHASFPWTIFRPPAVYGPGDREMLPILKLARKGLVTPVGPVDQRLSLIHADDLAAAVLAWLKASANCNRQTYTLDDGHAGGYSWDEIAAVVSGGSYRRLNIPRWLIFAAGKVNLAVSRALGYAPMLTPGKARELTQDDWVCNNRKLTEDTGWLPKITLKDGVKALFQNNSSPQND
ncbi:MAG: NAD-dependent epimerase/dehydratase family protein [Xanthomonadales bacterium]|nr:NAD-dependent epimerase/dehydratase family protein [Gammaproteobacteria bacterium]NND56791.1 NAD-dependent epimerase/dehydratase family protein [Xanthomonadales bacterium]